MKTDTGRGSQGVGPVRIKICGLTREEDARAAAELGADAVGFVLYPGSPRCVDVGRVAKIIERLPPYVTTVGVFANQQLEEVSRAIRECGFDLVQLQGDESPEFCRGLGARAVKAIRVKDATSLEPMNSYSVRAFVLDAYREDQLGGTGKTFDWELALKAKQYGRIILAGGLTPDNVRGAVKRVAPYAVDVSSGVETAPGWKDHQMIDRFIRQARG